MAEKYSAIYRGAWKQGLISPQKTHPPTNPHHSKTEGKKLNWDKETRKENLNSMLWLCRKLF